MGLETATSRSNARKTFGFIFWLVIAWLASTAFLRWSAPPLTSAAEGDHLWELQVQVKVTGAQEGDAIRVAVPASSPSVRLVGQRIQHPGWRQRFRRAAPHDNARSLVFVATEPDPPALDIAFSLHQHADVQPAVGSVTELSTAQRERTLSSSPLLGLEHEAVKSLAMGIAGQVESRAQIPAKVFATAAALPMRQSGEVRPVPEVLAGRRASGLERAYVMIALARVSGVPARLVTGLLLEPGSQKAVQHWVELYDEERGWQGYDPTRGFRVGLPPTYLPLARSQDRIAQVDPERGFDYTVNVTQADELLDVAGIEEQGWDDLADLQRLPLETRETLSLLLLLPLAVLVSTLFRELAGVQSYGTFTPALFALALTFTEWKAAAIVLAMVLAFGVLGRLSMPFGLRRQPRLTIVMVLVAVGMSVGVSVMELLQWNHGGAVVLLPIVILTTLVDRIYSTLDAEGLDSALIRLGWTLLLAVFFCLPVLQIDWLGRWLVRYPETHLLTLAVILALGLYKGRRLCDFPGLRWLAWPPPTPKKPRSIPPAGETPTS